MIDFLCMLWYNWCRQKGKNHIACIGGDIMIWEEMSYNKNQIENSFEFQCDEIEEETFEQYEEEAE